MSGIWRNNFLSLLNSSTQDSLIIQKSTQYFTLYCAINGHMVLNWQPDFRITILSRITCCVDFPFPYFTFMVLLIDICILVTS